jgi:hypothetical protein
LTLVQVDGPNRLPNRIAKPCAPARRPLWQLPSPLIDKVAAKSAPRSNRTIAYRSDRTLLQPCPPTHDEWLYPDAESTLRVPNEVGQPAGRRRWRDQGGIWRRTEEPSSTQVAQRASRVATLHA